jgi:hypothetical protein
MITRFKKIQPDLEFIDDGKKVLRAATIKAGGGLTLSSALGVVTTNKGSDGGATGEIEQKLVPEKFLTLPVELQAQLKLAGVVVETPKMKQKREPSVSIKPATTLPDAAVAA